MSASTTTKRVDELQVGDAFDMTPVFEDFGLDETDGRFGADVIVAQDEYAVVESLESEEGTDCIIIGFENLALSFALRDGYLVDLPEFD